MYRGVGVGGSGGEGTGERVRGRGYGGEGTPRARTSRPQNVTICSTESASSGSTRIRSLAESKPTISLGRESSTSGRPVPLSAPTAPSAPSSAAPSPLLS